MKKFKNAIETISNVAGDICANVADAFCYPVHVILEKRIKRKELLMGQGIDFDTNNAEGVRLLGLAVEKGDLDGVKFIVKNGLDITNMDNVSLALFNAEAYGKKDIAKYLKDEINARRVDVKDVLVRQNSQNINE